MPKCRIDDTLTQPIQEGAEQRLTGTQRSGNACGRRDGSDSECGATPNSRIDGNWFEYLATIAAGRRAASQMQTLKLGGTHASPCATIRRGDSGRRGEPGPQLHTADIRSGIPYRGYAWNHNAGRGNFCGDKQFCHTDRKALCHRQDDQHCPKKAACRMTLRITNIQTEQKSNQREIRQMPQRFGELP